jgi:hypothetical protein
MAMALTVEETIPLAGNEYLYIGTITITGTYTTGGDAVDATGNERFRHLIVNGKGYVWEFDNANQKLLMYRDNATATAAALPQVANAADHTGASGVTFIGIGQ